MQKITQIPKLPLRKPDAHKGSFGKVCIIGGSLGMSGAPAIAGRAAMRSGAGLVRVAIPQSILSIVAAIEPCCTTIPLPNDKNGCISAKALGTILKSVEDNDVLAFGPGVGTTRGVKDVLAALIAQPNLKIIIDADGLNCLAKTTSWTESKKASLTLTPHPGEMKRLWASLFREAPPTERTDQAAALSERTGCTIVLKGAETVVCGKNKIYTNTTGNPGMATAGSGDVLTGIIAALAGQGLDEFDSAVSGVYIHGLAGDIAAEAIGQISLIATDIIDCLGNTFKQ